MPLTKEQLEELKGHYYERQLTTLREKYSDEMTWTLWKRWEKPLLKPESITRDKNGKITGGEEIEEPLKEMGWYKDKEGSWFEVGVYIRTFHNLLSKRLKDIEHALEPEIEKIDKSLEGEKKREEYQAAWKRVADSIFVQTLKDLRDYGLDKYTKLSYVGIILYREIPIDLRGANCRGAHFDGADCIGARFDGANCQDAHFDGADSGNARFEGTTCFDASFIGANFWKARFKGADCKFAHFDGANCSKAHFDRSDCRQAHFDRANCINAQYNGANCRSTHFNDANCHEAHFDGAYCRYANYDGANCSGVHFDSSDCDSASFGTKERVLENGDIERNPCKLNGVTWNRKSSFIGVDTSNVDWSKNPEMKRFIEQQQFVHSMKEAYPKWKWLISIIDNLSDINKWWRWAVFFILAFANLFFWVDYFWKADLFYIKPEITAPALSYLYFSVVTFTTLGFGDVTAIHWFSMPFVMLEVILGYVFLGGLVTFLANWLGRR